MTSRHFGDAPRINRGVSFGHERIEKTGRRIPLNLIVPSFSRAGTQPEDEFPHIFRRQLLNRLLHVTQPG